MRVASLPRVLLGIAGLLTMAASLAVAEEPEPAGAPRAFIDGTGPGWKALGEEDFVHVNRDPETWTWKDGEAHCTGQPVGVIRSAKPYTNFELVAQWRHLKSGGNSGIFVWATEEALKGIKPGTLPRGGIEVQILDHGYAEQYEKRAGKKKARLVHDPRRRLPRRHVEDDPVPADLAQRLAELPPQGAEQGRGRVEPLLRPRHQRRGPPVGQRRGGLRRDQLRAPHGLPLPGVRGVADRVQGACGSASCRDPTRPEMARTSDKAADGAGVHFAAP